jgi:hypothetical protein
MASEAMKLQCAILDSILIRAVQTIHPLITSCEIHERSETEAHATWCMITFDKKPLAMIDWVADRKFSVTLL